MILYDIICNVIFCIIQNTINYFTQNIFLFMYFILSYIFIHFVRLGCVYFVIHYTIYFELFFLNTL